MTDNLPSPTPGEREAMAYRAAVTSAVDQLMATYADPNVTLDIEARVAMIIDRLRDQVGDTTAARVRSLLTLHDEIAVAIAESDGEKLSQILTGIHLVEGIGLAEIMWAAALRTAAYLAAVADPAVCDDEACELYGQTHAVYYDPKTGTDVTT